MQIKKKILSLIALISLTSCEVIVSDYRNSKDGELVVVEKTLDKDTSNGSHYFTYKLTDECNCGHYTIWYQTKREFNVGDKLMLFKVENMK